MPEMMNGLRQALEFQAKTKEKLSKHSDKAEEEIFVKMWAELGDSVHSYFTIMAGISAFFNALHATREALEELPIPIKQKILKYFVQLMEMDVAALQIMLDTKEEMDRNQKSE